MQKNSKAHKKPKACYLYYSRITIDAILMREANALKEKGFDIDMIGLRTSAKERVFQTINDMKLYCIQSRELKQEKKAAIYFLRLALFFLKATLFLSILGIYKRYKIIHVTSPPDIMVFSAIVPKLLGAKIILDIHDIGPELYMRKLNAPENKAVIKLVKYLEKLSCRFADHVFTVTDIWRDRLISRSVSEKKCNVLLNVPDDNIFKKSSSIKSKNCTAFDLYYHGTFDEHFGVDTMIKAMPLIRDSIPDVQLHLYGGGRRQDEYEMLVRELKVNDCVKFHGFVLFHDLPKILANADIGIVPTKGSVFSDEALSMKSLEYISLGIPIVISKTIAHSYYYSDSMVMFFKPDSSEDLAKSVTALFKNKEQRKSLIENSQNFIQKISWGETKKIYFEVIEQLLS